MKNIFILAGAVFLLGGCGCKPFTWVRATLFNKTSHSIKIICYRSNVIYEKDTTFLVNDTIWLAPDSSTLIADYESVGRKVPESFYAPLMGFAPEDSTVVVFDDIYSMAHYHANPDTSGRIYKHYYLYASPRNITNPDNYYFFVSHHGSQGNHEFYFTEQDYLDAKD